MPSRWNWFDNLCKDVVYGLRQLRKTPGWTTLVCQPEESGFACDLEDLVAGLAPRAAPRIAIRDLDFAYRQGADVFHGAALTLEPGRAYRLFGRNGAGKTTLLKILVGVLAPRRGDVLLGEQAYAPWRDGNAAFALATQNPDNSPPPPTGATTAFRSGTSSSSSSAAVPWPAITSGWSNGGISVAPVRFTTSAAVSSRAASVGSQRVTTPPYPSTAAFFTAGAVFGMTT